MPLLLLSTVINLYIKATSIKYFIIVRLKCKRRLNTLNLPYTSMDRVYGIVFIQQQQSFIIMELMRFH